MIDFGRVANNLITVLILFGFGYMIYLNLKGEKFSLSGIVGKGKDPVSPVRESMEKIKILK